MLIDSVLLRSDSCECRRYRSSLLLLVVVVLSCYIWLKTIVVSIDCNGPPLYLTTQHQDQQSGSVLTNCPPESEDLDTQIACDTSDTARTTRSCSRTRNCVEMSLIFHKYAPNCDIVFCTFTRTYGNCQTNYFHFLYMSLVLHKSYTNINCTAYLVRKKYDTAFIS